MIEIEGLRIFGSPYSVKYGSGAFQYRKEEDELVWAHLPENIDILITHSPPFGILDATAKGVSAGSKGLLKVVQRIRPKLHIFGHIHEGHGERTEFGVKFMNVAKKFEYINFN